MENPNRWKLCHTHIFMHSNTALPLILNWFISVKQLGDTWTSDCNTCVCDEDSMSIICQPVQCPAVQSPNCSEPGHQLVNKTNGCCTTPSCGQLYCWRPRCDNVTTYHKAAAIVETNTNHKISFNAIGTLSSTLSCYNYIIYFLMFPELHIFPFHLGFLFDSSVLFFALFYSQHCWNGLKYTVMMFLIWHHSAKLPDAFWSVSHQWDRELFKWQWQLQLIYPKCNSIWWLLNCQFFSPMLALS